MRRVPLCQRALKIMEKTLGPENIYTTTGLHQLADLYRNQGKYSQALPLYQRSLEITEKVLGPENTVTAGSLNDLALAYKEQGNYTAALLFSSEPCRYGKRFWGQTIHTPP